MKSKNSYQQVLKATSLFGGVQVFKIIIAVVRSKVIALLIGATGMGIASLLVSTMDMINGFTNFGLDRSAVRDISLAKESGDTLKINKTISVLQRLIWFTAILGALVMILFASLLSELAFENTSYTFAFMWLGIALIFKQLTSGRMVILQGLRHLQSLAKANVFGNLLALIVTLPLYYYLKLDGIVPAIIVSSMISFLVVLYMSFKKTEKTQVSTKEAFVQGKGMLLLGLTLSF
ncbi:MAG: oligosaccharide flippase family protein, partial [Bacteroidetes bacterium]|nr:oligosaccharide flippase family protein [Bacteroidota bacterium]